MKSNTILKSTKRLTTRSGEGARQCQVKCTEAPADPPIFEESVMTVDSFMPINIKPQIKQATSFKEKPSTLTEEAPCLRQCHFKTSHKEISTLSWLY